MKRKVTILTSEERDVLVLVGLSLTNTEIAERLCMSVNNVKNLMHQAFIKLQAHNRNEAVFFALTQGEISLNEIYSLDEIADYFAGLSPEMLRTIAKLVRQKHDHGRLQTKGKHIPHIDRKQNAMLTKRERDVLILVGRGLTNKEIADRLYISISAIRAFIYRASAKMGARTKLNAFMFALKQRELNIGEVYSLDEMVLFLAPLGPELIETVAQLLSQKLERLNLPSAS